MDEGLKAANGDNAGMVGAATQLRAPHPPSQLERFDNELSEYGELLNNLENKLDVVSERSPSKEDNPQTDRVHISTLIAILSRNNQRLRQITSEIVL